MIKGKTDNTDNSPHPPTPGSPFITLAFAVAGEVLGKNQTKAREGACKMVIPRSLLAS